MSSKEEQARRAKRRGRPLLDGSIECEYYCACFVVVAFRALWSLRSIEGCDGGGSKRQTRGGGALSLSPLPPLPVFAPQRRPQMAPTGPRNFSISSLLLLTTRTTPHTRAYTYTRHGPCKAPPSPKPNLSPVAPPFFRGSRERLLRFFFAPVPPFLVRTRGLFISTSSPHARVKRPSLRQPRVCARVRARATESPSIGHPQKEAATACALSQPPSLSRPFLRAPQNPFRSSPP